MKNLLAQLTNWKRSGMFFFAAFFSSLLFAADQEEPEAVTITDEVFTWQWLDTTRDRVSRNVGGFGRLVDDWLAGEVVGERSNESYLRLSFNQVVGSLDGYDSKFKIGGSLDLPRASERWKLIFESDVTDLNSLRQNRLDNVSSSTAIGAFRFRRETRSGWDLEHDIGLRAKLPLDPFYRFRAAYSNSINSDWSYGFRQKFWIFSNRGAGYDTRLYFDRKIDDQSFLRIQSDVEYKHDDHEVEFAQSISVHRNLGDLETISYELGVIGDNMPSSRINNYYVQTAYRKAIREDWLILEAIPQILVSSDQNWRPQPRFILNLQMYFFDF